MTKTKRQRMGAGGKSPAVHTGTGCPRCGSGVRVDVPHGLDWTKPGLYCAMCGYLEECSQECDTT